MPMFVEKPWVVYRRDGHFANIVAKYPTQSDAEKRIKKILKRSPGASVGIYYKRPIPTNSTTS